MGWLWANSQPASSKAAVGTETSLPSAQSAQPTGQQQDRHRHDEQSSDPELDKFLAMWNAELGIKPESEPAADSTQPPAEPPQPRPSTKSSNVSSWNPFRGSSAPPPPPTSTILEEATMPSSAGGFQARRFPPHPDDPDDPGSSQYPETMSCRVAFDYAFQCKTLRGQWQGAYRYGEWRDCSEPWADFWFCMRTRTWGTETRARATREYFADKERRKYYAPGARSSEDVWEARTTKVPVEEVFAHRDMVAKGAKVVGDAEAGDDSEWRAKESERRRKIRQELGIADGKAY